MPQGDALLLATEQVEALPPEKAAAYQRRHLLGRERPQAPQLAVGLAGKLRDEIEPGEQAGADDPSHLGLSPACGDQLLQHTHVTRRNVVVEIVAGAVPLLRQLERRVVKQRILAVEKLGAKIVEVSLPRTELAIPVYYIIAPAEASSNLSRFDGVKFGHRAKQHGDLLDMYKKTRAEGFGDEVKRRIMIGTYVLSHGYYDAYYLQAQKIRRLIAADFVEAFKSCDVIMGPASPDTAFAFGEKSGDPVKMYLSDIYTISTNLAGLPGMSIPAGFGNHKLPVGLQIIGNYFEEAKMLNVAHQYQLATDWHKQMPEGI